MEYRQLYRVMRQWAAEPVTEAWSHSRQLLRDYVLILANSGLRVGVRIPTIAAIDSD
jgi:hypothetical protein